MRSTYAAHQSIVESIRDDAANRRTRAVSAIIAARAEERARQSRNARIGLSLFVLAFIAGSLFIAAPII